MRAWIAARFRARSIRGHGRGELRGVRERRRLEAAKAPERLEQRENGECAREPLVRVIAAGAFHLRGGCRKDRCIGRRDDRGAELTRIGKIGDALDPTAESPRMAAVRGRDLGSRHLGLLFHHRERVRHDARLVVGVGRDPFRQVRPLQAAVSTLEPALGDIRNEHGIPIEHDARFARARAAMPDAHAFALLAAPSMREGALPSRSERFERHPRDIAELRDDDELRGEDRPEPTLSLR